MKKHMSKFEISLVVLAIVSLFVIVIAYEHLELTLWAISAAIVLPFVIIGLNAIYHHYKDNK